jgi:hypothetical protein
MAPPSKGTDRWPTILWIAWRAGEVEYQEPLCLAHRAHVFERYSASAHGLKRRGDLCSMCAAKPRGRGTRGSGRRVSPIRHDP